MGSRRLPGKTLMTLGGQSILAPCPVRLYVSGFPVIGATTNNSEDDGGEKEARRLGAQIYRGESEDVLARYIGAARAFDVDTVVRATADNPLVDPDGPR